jgi:L-rhamnono-1,4-lactonase
MTIPPPQRILDSHIHLWPSTATSAENHGWMTPGNSLAKRHGIADYLAVTDPRPGGFVYVETDRYLPSPSPDIGEGDSEQEVRRKVEVWAKEPLEEIRFLRRIVEGKAQEGDGVEGDQGSCMKGVVLYAPFHLPSIHFSTYMSIAEEVAGPGLWACVVGFRYLLQGKGEGIVESMLQVNEGDRWLDNLRILKMGNAGKGWCFDVGVDTHRDGMGPFEAVLDLIQRLRSWEEKEYSPGRPVRFVLSTSLEGCVTSQRVDHERMLIESRSPWQTLSLQTTKRPLAKRHVGALRRQGRLHEALRRFQRVR